jgi:hypothetical protein
LAEDVPETGQDFIKENAMTKLTEQFAIAVALCLNLISTCALARGGDHPNVIADAADTDLIGVTPTDYKVFLDEPTLTLHQDANRLEVNGEAGHHSTGNGPDHGASRRALVLVGPSAEH